MTKKTNRVIALIVTLVMIISLVPTGALASIPNWEENNVVFEDIKFLASKKSHLCRLWRCSDWQFVPKIVLGEVNPAIPPENYSKNQKTHREQVQKRIHL